MNVLFFLNSAALGVGLAMDAFSVSLANGLHEPYMKLRRMCVIAGVYAVFQYAMPMIGWICVHTIVELFSSFQKMIPWIALLLLLYLGGKMLLDGIRERSEMECREKPPAQDRKSDQADPTVSQDNTTILMWNTLLLQGVATSIDALSVGFTIAEYSFAAATVAALIIAVVTFLICLGGLCIGKKAGTRLSWKASVLGGSILIVIGIEIFLRGIL